MSLRRMFGIRTASMQTMRPALALLWTESDGIAKRLVVVALLLVLGGSVTAAVAPVLLKEAVDQLGLVGAEAEYLTAFQLIIAYALALCLERLQKELRGLVYGRADQRVQRKLSFRLFRHVMSLPLRFHLNRKTGALSQTLTNGLVGYRMVLHHAVLTVLPVVVELMTMATVLVLLDHAVFLLIIGASLLLYTLAFWFGVVSIRKPARAASTAAIDANALLTDSIINYETVKCFAAEAQAHQRFGEALIRTENQWRQLYWRKMKNGLAVAFIFSLSLGLSMYVAVHEVYQGTMSIGEFVLVNAFVLRITLPLEMIGFAFRDIAEGMGFVEKMLELLGQRRESDPIDSSASLPDGPPSLIFDSISYSYRPEQLVLKDINFTVPPGNTIAVVGASGSGKSSLIRLLLRLVEPTEGQITLSGVPISDIPTSVLRSAIAVVPQDIALFNDSIAYNIGIGNENSAEADIVAAAKIALVHDFIVALPNGYDTKVGERGVKLSGGEKQRIAIARAAIRNPMVFIFDEATSSLDSKTEHAILHNLIRMAKTTTTLIIAHRLSTIVHADQILVLDQGTVVEYGTHSALLKLAGTYASMWHAQRAGSPISQDHTTVA